jgi:hypothetical protein
VNESLTGPVAKRESPVGIAPPLHLKGGDPRDAEVNGAITSRRVEMLRAGGATYGPVDRRGAVAARDPHRTAAELGPYSLKEAAKLHRSVDLVLLTKPPILYPQGELPEAEVR